jgi:hypothetical protein
MVALSCGERFGSLRVQLARHLSIFAISQSWYGRFDGMIINSSVVSRGITYFTLGM